MENLFGRWKGLIQSVLIAGIVAVTVLVVVVAVVFLAYEGY